MMMDSDEPVPHASSTSSKYAQRLRARCTGPAYELGETDPQEYLYVRLTVLAQRAERAYTDIYDAEVKLRAAMREAYTDETYDLKWRHRQVQLQVRRDFDTAVLSEKRALEAAESTDRQDLYEECARHFAAAYDLQEFRRREKRAEQLVALKSAVAANDRSEHEKRLALDHADERETLCRDETRARSAIEAEEDALTFTTLWLEGSCAGQQLRVAGAESRGRARLVALEWRAREANLRALQQVAVVSNAEAFYRAKIVGYLEPRSFEALTQKFHRELDFSRWQERARTSATRWAGEDIVAVPLAAQADWRASLAGERRLRPENATAVSAPV